MEKKLKYRRCKTGLAALGLLTLLLMGATEKPAWAKAAANQQTIDIIDGNGNPMTVHKPVERIIVEYMDNAELVRILGGLDKVVGVSGIDYVFEKCVRQFPILHQKTSLGLFWKLDFERIIKLSPDLLLTFSADVAVKQDKLSGVDVVFLGLYYPDLLNPESSRYLKGVRTLGRILDAEPRADAFINWHLNLIKRIKSRTEHLTEVQKPEIFIAHANAPVMDTKTYRTAPQIDTLSQAGTLAGAKNIADQLPQYFNDTSGFQVDPEWLMARNPDIIILHAVDRVDLYGYETDDIHGLQERLKVFMSRPELARIKAVKDKKVFVFDGHFRNDASGGVVAAAYLARIFHPDLFSDLDPEAIHQAYLDMQGVNYDLNEHGIFVYPPIEEENGLMGIPDRYKGQDF